jgi:predicted esterase
MLHGAGGNAEHGLHLLQHYADGHNIIILAPASKEYSWDIIAQNSFGPDVILLDQALDYVFNHFFIDVERIAIGGFSDGASYALSIGIGNGDLFTHIVAFSPGFYYTPVPTGKPSVFISHGTQDKVLPINPCSRRIVPELKTNGLAVTYKEFEGAHEIPPFISKSTIDWFFQ